MADISSTLSFQDHMSSAMQVISNRMDEAAASAKIAKYDLEALQEVEKNAKAHLDALTSATMKDNQAIKEAQKAWQDATKAVDAQTLKVSKYETALLQNEIRLKKIKEQQDKFNNSVFKGFQNISIFGITLGNVIGNFAIRAFDSLKNSIGMAIQTASDLAEVQNVVDVAFGNSSKIIDEWSKNTLDKFGLNELSAKRYVGTMGAMLKSSGITGDAMMQMSTKIAELSGDMASFYNLSNEDAFAKIRAGISGVTMPLKQLGIDMSEANLSAFALGEGLKIPYNKMSESSKMIIRYQYLLKTTKDAQGDFERTQDSFANQQKLLTENWSNLSSAIANLFIPALAKGMQVANYFMKAAMGLIDVIKMLTPALIGMAAVIITANIPAIVALGKQYVIVGIQAMAAGLKMAAAWLIGLGPIGWITAAVGVLIGTLSILINKNKAVAETFWGIVSAIDTALTKFAQWRNRDNAEKVAELQAGLDKRIANRQARVENIGKKEEQQNKNAIGAGFEWKDLITSGGGSGKALKTKQQGTIELKEDDIELLHDIATRDYAQYFQQLTPNLTIPNMVIHETADVNQVIGAVANAITGSISSSMQGGYATA